MVAYQLGWCDFGGHGEEWYKCEVLKEKYEVIERRDV
jgi:hypothetical protein